MNKYHHMKKELTDVSDFLIALGDEKRQAIIIRLLEEETCQGIQVGEMIEATGLSRPAISHHLKILRQAKIVAYRSEGTKNFYYLNQDIVHNALSLMHVHH